jgi:hypothetical protein
LTYIHTRRLEELGQLFNGVEALPGFVDFTAKLRFGHKQGAGEMVGLPLIAVAGDEPAS